MNNWLLNLGADREGKYVTFSEGEKQILYLNGVINNIAYLNDMEPDDALTVIAFNHNPVGFKVVEEGSPEEMEKRILILKEETPRKNFFMLGLVSNNNTYMYILEKWTVYRLSLLFNSQPLIESYETEGKIEYDQDVKYTISRMTYLTHVFLQHRLDYHEEFSKKYWSYYVPSLWNGEMDFILEYSKDYNKILGVSIIRLHSKREQIVLFYRREDLTWNKRLMRVTLATLGTIMPCVSFEPKEAEYLKGTIEKFNWRLTSTTTDGESIRFVYNEPAEN